MTAEASGGFAKVFSQVVQNAVPRLNKLKKELARDCGMRADRFSHLQAGSRRPSHSEVLRIGRGLRLGEATTNRLLLAAGFPPLDSEQGRAPGGAVLTFNLVEPERAIALAEIEADHALVRGAWDHYLAVQADVQARDWAKARDRYEESIAIYWRLRAMASRYLAQVDLVAATADPHVDRVAEAETKCVEGLEAAEIGRSRTFQVMLLTQLASIKRLRSDYEAADELYDRAFSILEDWGRNDSRSSAGFSDRQAWRDHWSARIQRVHGVLEMLKGNPTGAMRRLDWSLEHFKRGDKWDELSQVCFGLGWANGLLGHPERAASYDRQGLDYVKRHYQVTGQKDDQSLLQGHVYLGGDYLDLDDLTSARTHLEEAMKLAVLPRLRRSHDAGRVHLLLGRLEMKSGALDLALPRLQTALEFFSGLEEQRLRSTAHNEMGDYYLLRGEAEVPRALDHYSRALHAARACRPPNPYYECAALVNMCRVRVAGGVPGPELSQRHDGQDPPEAGWEPRRLIGRAQELARTHGYRNHMAWLALLEAEFALKRGEPNAANRAAADAFAFADNFSPHLLGKVKSELRRLGLPERLIDVPMAGQEGG